MDATQDIPSPDDPLLCCRACLSTDGRLFNIHEYNLADAFADITGTPVTTDTLPQYLCAYCGTQLLKSAAFRDMCLFTQEITLELLKEQMDLDSISKINRPSNLVLTINQIYSISINPQTHNKQKQNLNIAGIIKKTGATTEFENQNFLLNIPTDKLEYINKRVRNIQSALKKKAEVVKNYENDVVSIEEVLQNDENDVASMAEVLEKDENDIASMAEVLENDENDVVSMAEVLENDENDVASMAEVIIHVEIDDTNHEINEAVKEKSDFDPKGKDESDDVNAVKIPTKRRKELNKKVEAKKMRKDMKTVSKQKCTAGAGIKRKAGNTKRKKRKYRKPENDFMPEYDFVKFESAHDVKIITLTKQEQVEEFASRKQSRNYLESRLKCEDCGKGFNAEAAYNNHLLRHNPVQGEFACEICTMRYQHRYQVQIHQDSHRLKLVCNACNFVSRTRSQAITHHEMHAGRKYQCQHCGKTYDKRSTYFSHVRTMHPALCAACDECGETFASENGLRFHKQRTHREKSRSFKCPTCSANFVSVEALNRHAETAGEHIALRPCEQCGENCASEDALHTHVAEKHPKETHRCEECDMTFPTAAVLDVHVRRKHLGQRPPTVGYDALTAARRNAARARAKCHAPTPTPAKRRATPTPAKRRATPTKLFVCEHCGRVMKNSARLVAHQQYRHKEKAFACSHCAKSFAFKGALETHLRKHTGEKPFQCTECPLTFSMKSNLNRHHKTVHLGQRKSIPCNICGRVFTTPSCVRVHVNAVHRGMPWPKRNRRAGKPEPKSPAADNK